ncbi:two-component system, OmpR family, sensor histidine kinase TctE [Ketogulonicigenium robustum]|uniref:histidine kinase n=1 Tax=Ketogulonicigenium robustum TaxID=92947 RepID=A0A1W6P0F3_9RHOB|nr:sensor histidine kinase [Ketogulonicigenium robustum]ARO14881.1 two-component system, OmpR family, sensor histidine kinase TctE [Ketogulonicigenium robustum]
MARPHSLRLALALWMLPLSLFAFLSSLWVTHSNIGALADSAYDRSLAGAVRAIEENISTTNGGLGVQLPYTLLATLQAASTSVIYVRVSTDDKLVQIGDIGLPPPPAVGVDQPSFFTTTYLGKELRGAALRVPLEQPLYGAAAPQSLIVEVAETTESRALFLRRVADVAFLRDVAISLIGLALLVIGIGVSLRPLTRLKEMFDHRAPNDLSPIPTRNIPTEAGPLIDSFNTLLQRYADQYAAQRRFLDDASHQLRTPISVLQLQMDYALSAPSPEAQREAIVAMRPVIERATRMTRQLLTLARAENLSATHVQNWNQIDLTTLLPEVLRLHLAPARQVGVRLDLDLPDAPVMIAGDDTLIFEGLSNLLENAIRHSPAGATVAVTLLKQPLPAITIRDHGLGAPAQILSHLGTPFLTIRNDRSSSGTGLGLSLAQAVARAHGGDLVAENPTDGGFQITMRFADAHS